MRTRNSSIVAIIVAVLLLAGCGGMQQKQPPVAFNPVAMSITDTPPAGVNPLSFEINVTGASLQPSDSSKPAVNLLTHPVEVELKQLETENAILNTASVPTDTYSSLTLTFASPEMTILNQTGAPLTLGSKICANGQVCEFTPTLNQSSVTITGTPFPLMISSTNSLNLLLDFNLNSSIQTNLTISPNVTVTTTTAHKREDEDGNELEDVEGVTGKIQSVGANSFMLQSFRSGQTLTINVDSHTQFADFDKIGCATNSFACLKAGQIVEVEDLHIMPDGSMVAGVVHLDEDINEEQLEGTITTVDAAHNQFQIVIHDEEPDVAGITLGQPVLVSINTGAQFSIHADGLSGNLPAGASFASVSDLLAGQEVKIRPVSIVPVPAGGLMVTTDRVTLHLSQFTANVSSVSAPNFVVNNLPALFTSNAITQVQVQTSSATRFEGATGVSGIGVGNIVSLRGLLFKTAGDPILAAKKVRDRTLLGH